MAEKRMFAKRVIDSDAFLDMPLSAQALYFHLSMRADDDGFIDNPRKIQRMVGATDDDCKLLIMKQFIITFETGVIVIKHWKIHNTIARDRYKPTIYQDEKSRISTDKNKMYTNCIQSVDSLETQNRLEEIREEENSLGLEENSFKKEKTKAKNKTSSYDLILSAVTDDSLRDLYNEYIKMRKLIKSPMTERALTMLINKVNELEPDSVERQKQLLETAIMNNWKSVYPLKDNIQTKQQQGTGNIFLDMYIKENGGLCDEQSGNVEDIFSN